MAASTMVEPDVGEDQTHISAFLAGDEAAFNQLVLKYRKPVYAVAYRFTQNHEEADDLAQETFLRAYQSLVHFRGDSSLKTWLLRIVSNLSLNHLKSGRISKDSGGEPEEHALAADPTGLNQILEDEERLALRKAIAKLPPKQKETLMLKTFQDLTCEQVAEIMQCSIGTVKANLFNAVQKLKNMLGEARHG
ncbi:MAG: sigma-70 family RNA polymerase sigma factor [Acidobacteria bacterium]|nr:sigma-70 family RNA polymerase sigma factor [Acidobacteriota bacterium]